MPRTAPGWRASREPGRSGQPRGPRRGPRRAPERARRMSSSMRLTSSWSALTSTAVRPAIHDPAAAHVPGLGERRKPVLPLVPAAGSAATAAARAGAVAESRRAGRPDAATRTRTWCRRASRSWAVGSRRGRAYARRRPAGPRPDQRPASVPRRRSARASSSSGRVPPRSVCRVRPPAARCRSRVPARRASRVAEARPSLRCYSSRCSCTEQRTRCRSRSSVTCHCSRSRSVSSGGMTTPPATPGRAPRARGLP